MAKNRYTPSAGTVEFVEDFSPIIRKLEKITRKTDTQIEAKDELNFGILAARAGITRNMINSPSDFLNLDSRAQYSQSDIYMCLWALAYSKDQEISLKEALNILVNWLSTQSEDFQRNQLGEVRFSEKEFNFTENDIPFISIIESVAYSSSKETVLTSLKLKAYQIGTGCDTSKAVSDLFY